MSLVDTRFPDLAARALGGAVVAAGDEFFAAAANLNAPHPPGHRPLTFDERGQVYDGWETRRRRPSRPSRPSQPAGSVDSAAMDLAAGDSAAVDPVAADRAIVRLGAPGVIRRIVVDTAYFTGNFPESCSVEGVWADGYPSPDELDGWEPLVARTPLSGDTVHTFDVEVPRRFTHVRLTIHPDGGVARLRVYGEPVPDPGLIALQPLDLAALANGAYVLDCSNAFYSTPAHLLLPGHATVTGEGWETARRRDDGHDWVRIRLATQARIRLVEIDTRPFIGNAPGWIRLACGAPAPVGGAPAGGAPTGGAPPGEEADLLPITRVQPQTVHRFVLPDAPPADHVRLDILPDGGLGRLRLYGEPTDAGQQALALRWTETGR